MSAPKVGELFAGYGGLGAGVQAVLGGEIAWFSEFDKGPSKILAHRFPGVPNHGDITEIKWTPDCPTCGELLALYWNEDMPEGRGYYCPADGWFDLALWMSEPGVPEPVDILTGGSPCQDLSHAGRRAGMTEGTRSNLWVAMREAIAQLRPGLVVWENVRGAYSAGADSEVEPCPGCVGDGSGVHLRALGRVLGDLSDLGYDASWHGLRAADVGAPHGRFRVFVVARDASQPAWRGPEQQHLRTPPRPAAEPGEPVGAASLLPTPRTSDRTGAGIHGEGGLDLSTAVTLLPTPTTQDGANNGGPSQFDRNSVPLNALVTLLPTPVVNDMGEGKTVEAWDEWTAKLKASHANGNGHGASLSIEAQRLIPTPSVADSTGGHERRGGARGEELLLKGMAKEGHLDRWGQYGAAIQRWEHLTRPAPAPTETGPKGNPRLSAAFSEWMMGLPSGWVTDVPGITRNEALKALGNGVVPQQAAAALREMFAWEQVSA